MEAITVGLFASESDNKSSKIQISGRLLKILTPRTPVLAPYNLQPNFLPSILVNSKYESVNLASVSTAVKKHWNHKETLPLSLSSLHHSPLYLQ